MRRDSAISQRSSVCSERSIASSTADSPSETWLARLETRTNTREQVILAERFGEIANHAGLQCALPRPFVGKSSDKNGGNGLTGRDQAIMELNSGHPRHLHVCNHAGHDSSRCTTGLPRVRHDRPQNGKSVSRRVRKADRPAGKPGLNSALNQTDVTGQRSSLAMMASAAWV